MKHCRILRSRPDVSTRRFAVGLAICALGALPLLGCDALTSVEAPDLHQPEDFASAAGASALAAGAITRFNEAFGGDPLASQVAQSGSIADELFATVSVGSTVDWDRRDSLDPSSSGGSYDPLHTARIHLLTAIAGLQRTAPDSSARIGQLFALMGYTELFLGESFCSGVPLGKLDADFRPVYGSSLTTEQVYAQALADFDSAQVYGADDLRIVDLAKLGKGRTLLDLGRFSEAAEAVTTVPTSYVYHVTFVTGVLHNGLYGTGTQSRYTVPEREGSNGLNWRTAADPRVPLVNRSPEVIGEDGATEVWAFVPYEASNAPMPLANGIEARLIEAEAMLQAGDGAGWLAMHNTLRALVPDLPPLEDPGTPDARADLHFRERAFWLFLTAHRHGDLRRLVRQYGRDAEAVFPTGIWRDGVVYGTATNMAPPGQQGNNPNYNGCLNRDA